jgi:hypothetical protein
MEIHKVHLNEEEEKVQIDLSAELDVYSFNPKENDYVFQVEYGRWNIESKNFNLFQLFQNILSI